MTNGESNSTAEEAVRPEGTRTQVLIATLEQCVDRARRHELTLGSAFATLGEASYSFISIVLALPFLQPIPLGPLSVLGGLNFMALGWQLARGHETPWLPERLKKAAPPEKVWVAMLRACERILKICAPVTRTRMRSWVTGIRGKRVCGSLILTGGALMAIPFGGLPLNNSLPALVILFACIAELEEDGGMLLVALFWLVLTLVYFAVIIYGLVFLGGHALDWLKNSWPF
ncbi:MAG: exopolysaccharide biosynthesis protein [Thermoanaerobaculia bacterium]|nr:exopolysaccharide biosynthesis protein [Thermoanaerobaculia bacterium]